MNPASSAEQKYTLMGVPFTGVTEGEGLMISNIVVQNQKGSLAQASADHVMLWVEKDPINHVWGYEDWYLNNKNEWVLNGSSGTHFEQKHQHGLPAGTAFWYVSAKDNNPRVVTMSGAVASDVWIDIGVRCGQMNFICCPYPVALKLNDATMADWSNSKKSLAKSSADKIMIWIEKDDGVGNKKWNYEEWYLDNNGVWRMNSTTKFQDLHPNGIDVSKGFWYNAQNQTGKETIMIRFKSPIASVE